MAFEGELKSLLSPLFSGGFHPTLNKSKEPSYPYGTYYNVAGSPLTIHSGARKRRRVQLDIFANSYGEAKTLEVQVDDALEASTIACSLINSVDAYEEVQGVYRLILEYYMWA